MSDFSDSDLIAFKGKAIPRQILFERVKGLGWSVSRFGALTDEEIVQVVDGRVKAEGFVAKEDAVVAYQGNGAPRPPVDLDKDDPVPGVFDNRPPLEADEGPIPKTRKKSAQQPGKIIIPPPGSRLDPRAIRNPLKQGPADTGEVDEGDEEEHPGAQTVMKTVINVRPPRSSYEKVMSILDAAFQLASAEPTRGAAKSLIQSQGLERAFQTLYPDLAKPVLGKIDTSPGVNRKGGVILDVEPEIESGYIHIVTTSGVLTITGHNLNIAKD